MAIYNLTDNIVLWTEGVNDSLISIAPKAVNNNLYTPHTMSMRFIRCVKVGVVSHCNTAGIKHIHGLVLKLV